MSFYWKNKENISTCEGTFYKSFWQKRRRALQEGKRAQFEDPLSSASIQSLQEQRPLAILLILASFAPARKPQSLCACSTGVLCRRSSSIGWPRCALSLCAGAALSRRSACADARVSVCLQPTLLLTSDKEKLAE